MFLWSDECSVDKPAVFKPKVGKFSSQNAEKSKNIVQRFVLKIFLRRSKRMFSQTCQYFSAAGPKTFRSVSENKKTQVLPKVSFFSSESSGHT